MISLDIILVTYNQEQYVEQAMLGIFSQRLSREVSVRIVIADDHSSDNTVLVIHKLEKDSPYPVVFLPQEPNMGISKNYKRSFAASTADYVAILEGDDYWCNPNHLQNHVDFLESHRECVLSSNAMYIKNDIKGVFEAFYPFSDDIIYSGSDQARSNRIGNLSTCVFRGEILKILPDAMFELDVDDWLLGLELCKHGYIGKLKTPTSVYRINKNSKWASMTAEQQINENVARTERYDNFLEGIYHDSFVKLRHELLHGRETRFGRIKRWLPPFLVYMFKWIIPPILYKK